MERSGTVKDTDLIFIPDSVEIARVGGTVIAFFPVRREILSLNESAAKLLENVDGRRRLKDIVRMVDESAGDCEMSVDHAREFFEDLLEKGLVVRMTDASPDEECVQYIANPDVVSEPIDDDCLTLFNTDTRRRIDLNPTASVMWHALQTPRTIREILLVFCSRVNVDPDDSQITVDIRDFIEMMYHQGFIGILLERKNGS